MPIQVSCPHCNKIGSLEDRFAGRNVRCASCKMLFQIAELNRPAELPAAQADQNKPAESGGAGIVGGIMGFLAVVLLIWKFFISSGCGGGN